MASDAFEDDECPTTFKITKANLYVPMVTLSTEDNVKLTKQLSKGFQRSVYWNQYKTETKPMQILTII